VLAAASKIFTEGNEGFFQWRRLTRFLTEGSADEDE
jgi:hypothetical protein